MVAKRINSLWQEARENFFLIVNKVSRPITFFCPFSHHTNTHTFNRLLQSRRARTSATHRRTESLWNGKNAFDNLIFVPSFSNLFPITARRCRNESTRHDCRFVSCVRAHNARCSSNVQSSNYLFAFFSTCHLQFIEKCSGPCAETNRKEDFLVLLCAKMKLIPMC
jgi:hypothetical protein